MGIRTKRLREKLNFKDHKETHMDDNKLEEMRQVDDYVPIRIEPKSETAMLLKELSDTRAYLDVVLRDLEEVKQQNRRPVEAVKKKNIWKWFALLETVLVLSAGIIVWIYAKNQQSIPTMEAKGILDKDVEVTDTDIDIPVDETILLNEQLASVIAESSKTIDSEFVPSVVTLFGYEYLMLRNGDVDIYYRNEFPKNEVKHRQTIMIDNGDKIAEFDWAYDLKDGLSALIPYDGEYFTNGKKYLVFPIYEKNGSSSIPKQLRSVEVDNLLEQEPIDIKKQLGEVFTVSYEEKGNNTENPDTRMSLQLGAATYTYAIKSNDYINAVYEGVNLVSFDQYFTLTFDQDKIALTLIPYLPDEEYLGEMSGRITLDQNRLQLSNVTYASYALANQEDVENEGVIIPRTNILGKERISLWGFHNETYLLELSDIIERNQITQADLMKEETGISYYVDGEKKSIAGIDVSKFQGEIDWKKVKQAGIEFVIIRVGFRGYNQGTLELDPYFEENIKGANEVGIPVGVYFFSQAINKEEALEEAQFVIEQIKDYKITYPVILDTEHVISYEARANGLSRQVRTDIAKTFCDEIRKNGYHSMIYANTKWMIMGIDLEQLVDYDLWFAYYGNDLTFPYQFEMFQYSNKGTIPGIKGEVDLNISFKDYSKIR